MIFLANGGQCYECQDQGICGSCERGLQVARFERVAFVARREREILDGAKLPERVADFTLASYPSKRIPAYRQALDFVKQWDGHTGLILIGSYGHGKTGLLVSMLKAIATSYVDTPYRMWFLTGTALMDELRQAIGREQQSRHDPSIETYSAVLDRAMRVRLLAIDDLGAERSTDWVQERMFAIFNERYEHRLPTFTTTNFGLEQLATRLESRVYERLLETSQVIEVEGENLRLRGRK